MTDAANATAKLQTADCPMCGKAAQTRYKPFCSIRCADLDLGKWLKGDYAIPAEDLPFDQDTIEEP